MIRHLLLIVSLITVLTACGGTDSELSQEAEAAFREWARVNAVPFQKERFSVV
jgi:hypothetical protein